MEYLNLDMRSREFASFLMQLIKPFKTCSDWFLDYHYFVLDENYIIVDQHNQKVRFIYLPIVDQRNSEEDILKFFENVIIEARISDNPQFAMELIRVIKKQGASLTSLSDYLDSTVSGDQSANVAPVPPRPYISNAVQPEPKPFIAPKPTPAPAPVPDIKPAPTPVVHENKKVADKPSLPGGDSAAGGSMNNDLANNLFGGGTDDTSDKKKSKDKQDKSSDKKGGGLLGSLGLGFGKKKSEDNPAPVTPAPNQRGARPVPQPAPVNNMNYNLFGGDSDTTVTLDDTEVCATNDDGVTLRLVEDGGFANCPKVINLDLSSGKAVVGRYDKAGVPQADFNFPMEFTVVGRRHFMIEKRGNDLFIIDLNSKNKTFVDGEMLLPNMAYPLSRNSKVAVCTKNQIVYRVN